MTDTSVDATTNPAPDAPYVRPDVRGFLDYVNAVPGPKMHELPVPAARHMYAAAVSLGEVPVGDLATMVDLAIPGPAGTIPARLFDAAETRKPGPAMMFFHGGGFVIGDLDTHASACAEIARVLDMPVISVDYRLAPEAPWPAAPEDCEAATRWVAESPAALGRTVTGLVLCGDSAGGTLTITTAMALRNTAAAVPVIVQAPLYPATDATKEYPSYVQFADDHLLTREGMEWFMAAYEPDVTNPRASPILGDLAGLPPAVVITASLDPLRDQGRAYAAALVEAGVPVVYREAVGNVHGFLNLRQAVPSSQRDVAGFLAAVKAMVAEIQGAQVAAEGTA